VLFRPWAALLIALFALTMSLGLALAASPVGPTYYGVQESALSQGNTSLTFGYSSQSPIPITAALGWLYFINGSFSSQGFGSSVSVQLNVDLVSGNTSSPSGYYWAQAVAGVRELGGGRYAVRAWVNLWNFTGPEGYEPGLGQPLNFTVVLGSARLARSPQGPYLYSSSGWTNVTSPFNLTLAVAAQGDYVAFYYGLNGSASLRPLLIVMLPRPVTMVIWQAEGMDAEFVVGGYAEGSEAFIGSWDALASLRYYLGPWSPPSPPGQWYCFPAMWPEGSQTAEGVSSAQGVAVRPDPSLWAFNETQGASGGQAMMATALVRAARGVAYASVWPTCANWTVIVEYYHGGSLVRQVLRPSPSGVASEAVPPDATYLNVTAVAWVGGFPAFENTSYYGSVPSSPPPLTLLLAGPLGYGLVLALASAAAALAVRVALRRVSLSSQS